MRLRPANVATLTTLLHARPRAGTQPSMNTLTPLYDPSMNTLTPLYDFTQSTDAVLEKWERIDDVRCRQNAEKLTLASTTANPAFFFRRR